MDNKYTTIKITKDLAKLLCERGSKGETYEKIIRRLVSKPNQSKVTQPNPSNFNPINIDRPNLT